jgi:hypothetical protein
MNQKKLSCGVKHKEWKIDKRKVLKINKTKYNLLLFIIERKPLFITMICYQMLLRKYEKEIVLFLFADVKWEEIVWYKSVATSSHQIPVQALINT